MMVEIKTSNILDILAKNEVYVKTVNGYFSIVKINRNVVVVKNNRSEEASIRLSNINDFQWYTKI